MRALKGTLVSICLRYMLEKAYKNAFKPDLKRTWRMAVMEKLLWLYRLAGLDERPCFLIGQVVEGLAL